VVKPKSFVGLVSKVVPQETCDPRLLSVANADTSDLYNLIYIILYIYYIIYILYIYIILYILYIINIYYIYMSLLLASSRGFVIRSSLSAGTDVRQDKPSVQMRSE
jgi:hypothetical protein